MKTLEEHEAEFWKRYNPTVVESKCGIACPKCGEELLEERGMILLTDPPQTEIHCEACGWRGSKH